MNVKSPLSIRSVKRARGIACLFSLERPRLGVTEISQLLELKKATVQGLIRTLGQQGFLRQDKESRKYELGVKLYALGIVFSGGLEFNQKTQEPASRLARELEQLVRVAIRNGNTAVIGLEVLPRTEPTIFYSYGARIPLVYTPGERLFYPSRIRKKLPHMGIESNSPAIPKNDYRERTTAAGSRGTP